MSAASDGLRKTLVGARVIAHIRANTGKRDDGLETLYRSGDPSRSEVLECVETLRESSTVTPSPTLDLMPEYWTKTEEAKAQLDLTRDQFLGSLRVRSLERNPNLDESARERVTDAGSAFLEKLCRERGLGVAQNLATSSVDQASLRTVSLIQHLPDHLAMCTARAEAFAVVHLVADILTKPTEAEARFLGLLCQAYFGQHLVGASETLAKIDLDLISGTCYMLDASVLVCLLSEGSESHEFAANLIEDLVTRGAILTTTSLFLEETAEHAHWAARLIDRHGEHSQQVIAALRGLGGYRANQFLLGYFLGSLPDTNFTEYLGRMLGMDKSASITIKVVADRLKSLGIQSLNFDSWEGFDQSCLGQRETIRQKIDQRRFEQGTYRHERQTQAEAEVAIIVDGIRGGKLQPPGAKAQDAFFLSSTRVVDRLPNLERRICLFPEGLAQWLWSSQATSPRHAELVFQQLLWGLAQGGVEFVDRKTLLRRFSGVIEAAETDLKTSISSRREYLVEKYGSDPAKAFKDADPLDLPRLADEVRQEALNKYGGGAEGYGEASTCDASCGENQREGPRRASQTAGGSKGETAQSSKKTTGCSEQARQETKTSKEEKEEEVVDAPVVPVRINFLASWGSDSNSAESHAKRRFTDSLGVGGLALEPRSRIGTCHSSPSRTWRRGQPTRRRVTRRSASKSWRVRKAIAPRQRKN